MIRLSVLLILIWPAVGLAQFDSTSTVLLRSGKSGKSQNLDSSRYKIRQPESRKSDDDIEERPGTYIASPVATKPTAKKPAPAPVPPPLTENGLPPAPPIAAPIIPVPPAAEEKPAVEAKPEEAPVTVQVKELIMGGNNQEIVEYKNSIHPEDPRANVISIALAPAYYYNASHSNYSYRRYTSNGPALGLGMNLWLTPFFGIQSKYFSTVSASQRSGTSEIPVDLQNFEAGFRFRRHFGYSRKSSQISWGLDWHDSLNKISKESTTAIGRKTSGLSLALEGEIPASNTYAHTFSLDVRPRMKHSERNTGVEVKSGTKNETNSLGISGGGVWTMDRHNQVFWRGQYLVERNLFDGEASQMDPHNDATPDGVSVTNSLLMFYFGFKWGS
jgi:hypothetical protein